jgi:hypothetical protein
MAAPANNLRDGLTRRATASPAWATPRQRKKTPYGTYVSKCSGAVAKWIAAAARVSNAAE